MTLVPDFSPAPVENTAQLITYFARERGLSEAQLQQVVALQRAQELRFSEALLALGFASAADLAVAGRYQAAPAAESVGQLPNTVPYCADPYSAAAEHIRALRTELLLRQPNARHSRTVLVSANTGDGRSELAAALAVAYAQLEQPTLLIDADLRQPRQHQLFGLERGPGLADTLGRGLAPRFCRVQGLPHLTVLTAGEAVTNPLELLHSKPFSELLNGLKASVRHVVIDTPAATRGADALAVARAAGSAVPLARLHHTALPAFSELAQRLRQAEVALLGGAVIQSRP